MQGITITYNNITLGDGSNFYISHLDIGNLPIRQADQLAAGRDGGFIFNQNYGMRTISLDVNIFSGSPSQLFTDIRNLRNAFARTNIAKTLTITYWDGSVKAIDCFPTLLPDPMHSPGNVDKSNFTIQLIAPYPFFKDSTPITTTLYLDSSLGFDYPMTYPFDYVAGATLSKYIFVNDGDVPALVAVRFNGLVTTPTLSNTSAGEVIQINTSISAGSNVSLSYTNTGRSIVDQSGTSYEVYFNGNTAFFFVPVGSNTFIFTAGTYDSTSSCNLSFTKYYLS